MAELILHIGSHKTGTSSIQHFLAAQREALAREDVAYLLPDRDGRHSAFNLIRTSGELEGFRARVHRARADRLLQPRATRNIVSTEMFFWLSDPEEVATLAELIRPRFDRITVLAYLRRQDLLAVSHRNQVMTGSPAQQFYGLRTHPLPEYRPHLHSYFDYATKLLDLWGGAFGRDNLLVVPFEPANLAGGDVVADFTARLGVNLTPDKKVRRNSSDGLERLFVGLKLAEMGLLDDLRRHVFPRLHNGGKVLPTRAEAEAFLAPFLPSNARLAAEIRTDGRPFSFPDSMEMYPETASELWTQDRVERIVDALLHAHSSDRAAAPALRSKDAKADRRQQHEAPGKTKQRRHSGPPAPPVRG